MKTLHLSIFASVCLIISALIFFFQPSKTPHPDPKLRSYESVSVVNKQKLVNSNKYRTVEEFVVTVQLSDDTYKRIDITEEWYNEIEIGQDINLPIELVNVDYIKRLLWSDLAIMLFASLSFIFGSCALFNDISYRSIFDIKPKVDI
jgi:hypothetical protein